MYAFADLFTEPATMITDFIIFLQCMWLGGTILATHASARSRALWAIALLLIGVSALLGGIHHGFRNILDAELNELVWQSTRYVIFLASFFMLIGHFTSLFQGTLMRVLVMLAVVKLLASTALATTTPSFLIAIGDYLPVLLAILCAEIVVKSNTRDPAAGWFIAGITVAFLAAFQQQMGWGLHEHFNHNDVYHLITLVSIYLQYRGIRLLQDAPQRWLDR